MERDATSGVSLVPTMGRHVCPADCKMDCWYLSENCTYDFTFQCSTTPFYCFVPRLYGLWRRTPCRCSLCKIDLNFHFIITIVLAHKYFLFFVYFYFRIAVKFQNSVESALANFQIVEGKLAIYKTRKAQLLTNSDADDDVLTVLRPLPWSDYV